MTPLQPSYDQNAFETLRRRGATWVEAWCLNASCNGRHSWRIAEAIDRWGPSTTLLMLARRGRCGACGRRGCHVQVSWEVPRGAPQAAPLAPQKGAP